MNVGISSSLSTPQSAAVRKEDRKESSKPQQSLPETELNHHMSLVQNG